LWSGSTAGSLRQISQFSDTVADQFSAKIFLEIMKVRDKYT
jgi:hypothetical protein